VLWLRCLVMVLAVCPSLSLSAGRGMDSLCGEGKGERSSDLFPLERGTFLYLPASLGVII